MGLSIGEGVDGLCGGASGLVEAATDLHCLSAPWGTAMPVEMGQDLQGADLVLSVAACGVAIGEGPQPARAGRTALVQAGLVALARQDPVRAATGEVGDVLALAVQRVGGHHDIAQIVATDRPDPGDFLEPARRMLRELFGDPRSDDDPWAEAMRSPRERPEIPQHSAGQ